MQKQAYDALLKKLYFPKTAQIVDVPPISFAMIDGEGDPNTSERFQEAVGALYAISYGIKMLPKKGVVPQGYFEYKVSALEGLWDMPEGEHYDPTRKHLLRWTLMIMQPPFVTPELFTEVQAMQLTKKKDPAIGEVRFETFCEGLCCQMLHTGPFDDEPATFAKMQEFTTEQGYVRTQLGHHEIYMSDFRRTAPEKLKTVLRFGVERG